MAVAKRYTRGQKNYSLKKGGGGNNYISSNLPIFFTDVIQNSPTILQTTKDTILSDFLHGFKSINTQSPELQKINKSQLQQLLSQWKSSSPDSIGEKLGEEMAEEIQNKMLTGAHILDNLEMIENARNNGGYNVNDIIAPTVDNLEKGLQNIKNRLLDYMKILYESGDIILLQKIISVYESTGTVVSDPELRKYSGVKFPITELQATKNKVDSALATLQQNLNQLGSMGTENGTPLSKLDTVLRGCRSALSEIGSEGIHEGLGAHCANIVAGEVDKHVFTPLGNIWKGTGSNWRIIGFAHEGSNKGTIGKLNGEQKKDDIVVKWTNGSYIINLPISMKARYSAKNYNPKTGGLRGELTPQGISLGELIDMTYKTKPKVFEEAWGSILVAPEGKLTDRVDSHGSGYPLLIKSWNEFKEAAKYVALYRALVGTGIENDFAALLIVNDKIFSVYDILAQADNPKIVRWANGKGIPEFGDIMFEVSGKYGKGNWPSQSERIVEERSAISKIYMKKYFIAIQLSAISKI